MSIVKIYVIHYNVIHMYFMKNNQNMEKYEKDNPKSGLYLFYICRRAAIKKCSNFCKKMVGCK